MPKAMQPTTASCHHLTLNFAGSKRHNPERAAISRHPSTTLARNTSPQSSLVAASQAAARPINSMFHSQHPSLEQFTRGNLTFHGQASNFAYSPVPLPIHQTMHVVPQFDGAGDQSSEEVSFINHQGELVNCLAVEYTGLERRDGADSHLQGTGTSQVLVIQPQVQNIFVIFLNKMRTLVNQRRLRQREVLTRWARCKSPLLSLPPLHTQSIHLVN